MDNVQKRHVRGISTKRGGNIVICCCCCWCHRICHWGVSTRKPRARLNNIAPDAKRRCWIISIKCFVAASGTPMHVKVIITHYKVVQSNLFVRSVFVRFFYTKTKKKQKKQKTKSRCMREKNLGPFGIARNPCWKEASNAHRWSHVQH